MIRPARQLGALFLLTGFLAGGFGLSDLDAVLFHAASHQTRPDTAHLELPGGCGAHAEHCVLALANARPAVVASAATKVRLSAPVAVARPLAPVEHRPAVRGTLQYSRAPPRASAR